MRRIDCTGEVYNQLTVESFSHTGPYSRSYYVCKCTCGNKTVLHIATLRSGNTKSCGCLLKTTMSTKRLPKQASAVNQIINGYKRHAKDRNISWELSAEDAASLMRSPCHYCGEAAGNLLRNKAYPKGFAYNGIDRKDANGIYEPSNVAPCCGVCNKAKQCMGEKEFINWANRITLYQKSKTP